MSELASLADSPAALWAAALYLLGVVAIGVWSARRTRNARDFFIAGQGLGLLVTGLATTSAAFSGFVFLGGAGLTYRLGVASFFICASTGFTAGMLCWVVAKRLRLLAEVRPIYTVPDAVAARFGSRPATVLSALAVLVGTVGYLGAQLLALGVLLDSVFGLRGWVVAQGWPESASLPLAMAAGAAVILFYSVAGGMVAGVYTDVFQGALMLGAAVAVFLYAVEAGGGVGEVFTSLAASDAFGAEFLDPLSGVPALTGLGFFFVFSIGTLGQPHMLHKFYMLKDPRRLKWLPLVIAVSQSLCLLIWVGVGLVVPSLVARGDMAALANPDDAAPAFLLAHLPPALAGMVAAGVLAAIMSTADSFANVGAAALVRDLPRAFGRPLGDELAWGRWAVAGLIVASGAFAWAYGDLIALLGTFAFGTFGAALAPALAIGLNWRRVTAPAATASIASGLAVNLILEFLARQTFFPGLPDSPLRPGVLPTAVSLTVSFTVLFLVTWLGPAQPEDRLPTDVEAVLEA